MAPKVKTEKNAEEKNVPSPPDRQKYDTLIEQKNNELSKVQEEIEAIKVELGSKSSEKNEHTQKKWQLSEEIQAFMEQINGLNEHKKELREGLTKKGDEKRAAMEEIKKTENLYQCKDEAEVDSAIARIEFRLRTNTMKLSEEKRLVQEIQTLKKMKPKITAAAAKVASLKKTTEELKTESHLPIKEQIVAYTQKANELWEQMEEVKKQRAALTKEWENKTSGTRGLEKKRNELYDEMRALQQQKQQLRQEQREEQQAWNRYEQEQRRVRQEQFAAERLAKQQEWEKMKFEREAEKLKAQPHLAETLALEQSISFLKSFLPKEEVKEKEDIMLNYNNPDGSVVLLKKKDREEEFFFLPTKKKGIAKKNKTTKSNIKHNAETFRLFASLEVKAPMTADEIPDTLKSLEDQLAKYNDKIAEWKRKLSDGTLLREFQEKSAGKGKDVIKAGYYIANGVSTSMNEDAQLESAATA